MTPTRPLAFLSLAALLGISAAPAHASVAAAASFDEKVDNAAAIVVGKCLKTESRFDPSGRWIVTYSTFAVEQSMKGAPAQTITVVTPGGSVNGIHQSSVGVPEFREGSENVLFIKNSKLGPTILYFDQGTYDVVHDAKGAAVVAPVASDVVHIDTQRGVAVPAEQPRTLDEFRGAVDLSIRTAGTRRQQMEIIAARQRTAKSSTITSIVANNKLLILAALIGILIAAWQLWRR